VAARETSVQGLDDERRIGMTNGWIKAGLAAAGLSLLLWIALFAAYRIDRPDAASVALVTVLLVAPPLLSYLAVMQVTREGVLWRRLAWVYGVALAWLVVQRYGVYPLLGYPASVGESLANFILLPAFGIAAWLGAASFLYRRRLDRALALQKDTELKLLQAQLAPHMLFNMLNTVYAALLTDRDKAIDLFLAMSEALRHLTGGADRTWVPLHEEIAFIEHYSALERARHPATRIAIETEGDMDAPVPPMLLATLFENAVKHGRLDDGGLDIRVSIRADDERMELAVINLSSPRPPAADHRAGLGLANVRSRLALLYPGQAALDIAAGPDRHTATIRIEL
jgi:hypothetical protein